MELIIAGCRLRNRVGGIGTSILPALSGRTDLFDQLIFLSITRSVDLPTMCLNVVSTRNDLHLLKGIGLIVGKDDVAGL